MTMTTVAARNREMGFIDATEDRNSRASFGKARKLQRKTKDWFAREFRSAGPFSPKEWNKRGAAPVALNKCKDP
jgi:hypothetical protein